jgi:hypothetical protein
MPKNEPIVYKGHTLIIRTGVDGIIKEGRIAYKGEIIDGEEYRAESRLGNTDYLIQELERLIDMRIAGIGLNILSSIVPEDPIEGARLVIEIWNEYAQQYIGDKYGQKNSKSQDNANREER